jgi:hypothetical protein
MATVVVKPVSELGVANLDDHESRVKEIVGNQTRRTKESRRYLDPEYATRMEARKPLYEWDVSCTYSRQNAKGKLETKTEKLRVAGQTEADAWAIFCDKIGAWPGPKTCERTIERREKIN